MANLSPELEDELRKLDEELEEGDITRKGYEKRRTLILSQYLPPQQAPASQRGGLRVHSPDDSDHPGSNDGSRAASLAALTAGSTSGTTQVASVRDSYDPYRSSSPVNHAQRFQERETNPSMQQSSLAGHSYDNRPDTLMVDSSADQSRTQTLIEPELCLQPGDATKL